jgi:thioredoxin reductase (NADPH)
MITPAELASIALFAALDHALRSRIAARSADINVNAGEWIAREGDTAYFWAVLAGEVESIKLIGRSFFQMTTFDPGEYFGEIPLMLSVPASSGLRAIAPSRLARIDAADFHAMVSESAEAAAMLAQSLVRRVNFIRDAYTSTTITQATIVGDRYDFACHDIREFLSRNQIAFEWLDPSDPGDATCLPSGVDENTATPLLILADGRRIVAPSIRELAEALALQTKPRGESYDVVIIGAGPAGLAAAVYGGSEGLNTIMIEREAPGGQAGTSSRIENYLGFPSGVSGNDLASRAFQQARRFDTEIVVTRDVTAIEPNGAGTIVELDGGERVRTRAVVIATGVAWRKLDADGAEQLVGRGVYYGATRTEAVSARGHDVFLIGGGNSAGQAAMYFSGYARSVTLLVRGDALAKSMSYYLIQQLRSKQNIVVELNTIVIKVQGVAKIESIVTHNLVTGEERERSADGLFVFIGADAETAWLPPAVERDDHGYIRTGRDVQFWPLERSAFPLETSIPGIFAAGDVRSESVKRVASGVGEGSMVIAFIHQYFEMLGPRR